MPTLVKIPSKKEGKKNLSRVLVSSELTLGDSEGTLPTNHLRGGGHFRVRTLITRPNPAPLPTPQQQLFPQLGSAGTGLLPHSLAGLARIFIICRCCRGLACKQTHFNIFICNHPSLDD